MKMQTKGMEVIVPCFDGHGLLKFFLPCSTYGSQICSASEAQANKTGRVLDEKTLLSCCICLTVALLCTR
jgi:hypothetical protein